MKVCRMTGCCGKQMWNLAYSLSHDGKPQVSAFSIQLDEARGRVATKADAKSLAG